jgi:lipoprotein-releasing system permease protein
MEKTKEIGILRALGATRGGIKMIFLMEGFSIGAFGTLAGGAAGYYLAKNINLVAAVVERFTGFEVFPRDIYYFSEIPVQIIPSDIFFIILFALLMALFAGLYPAHQAGKVSPVEAIRYE